MLPRVVIRRIGFCAVFFSVVTCFAFSSAFAATRVLLDTDRDGWGLWTAYGPDLNERYGSGNNSKHYHHPSRVLTNGAARTLEAVDTGVGEARRYQSGCLSTREAQNGAGFFRFSNDISSLRFEFEITISDWSHAVWPACWLRGVGGAGVHEIDVMEGFTAQTGTNLYRFAVHSAGHNNAIRDPWPGAPLPAGQRATVWAAVYRPGMLHTNDAVIRAGVDDTIVVNARDPYTADWWSDTFGWDLIVQQQIGGNWIGDPDLPYTGTLQNGNPGRPANEIPTWSGYSTMTIHRVRVVATLDELEVETAALDDGAVALHFNSWVGRDYRLEAASDLLTGDWLPVAGQGPRAGAGGPDVMLGPGDAPQRYFRLRFDP